jgi:hypothetical protein
MMRYLALALGLGISGAVLAARVPHARKAPPGVDKVKVDARTERVIKGALKYLASQQRIDSKDKDIGHWDVKYPLAMTGYTLMAFMSTGNLPGEGPYGKEVSRGLNYLLQQINEDTGIYGGQAHGRYMYGHGVATIALAELYGQTHDPRIRKKLQSVVERIVACQCTAPGRHQGGWRYTPVKRDADISVTVLQCVALRAAKNSGIDVPQQTLDNAVKYVKACFHPGSGGFTYQPGSSPGFARTAAAIYSLQVCGLYEDDWVKSGSKYLFANYHENQHYFVYGSFYAAPAQYMQGGDTWAKWYPMVKSHVLKKVKHERDIYRWDSVGRSGIGPVFTTSVFTMILAMPYHYIPLYQR